MSIRAEISLGEFVDKMTILEIKRERIADPAQRANVEAELDRLRRDWAASPHASADLAAERAELRRVNEALWEVEDRLRACEAAGSFDAEFVELARSVYRHNDRRAAIKRAINLKLGSALIEEKSHPEY